MARKKKTEASSPTLRCTAEEPIPLEKRDGQTVIHEFATTYEGAWFKTLTCANCGLEVKATA